MDNANIGDLLTRRAYLNPHLEAWVDDASGQRLSFDTLNRRTNQTAHMLRKLGVKKGDRVGLLTLNSTGFVESFFATAKIGGIVVPLNIRLVAEELAYILKNSGTTILIFGAEFIPIAEDLLNRGSEGTDIREWIYVAAPGDTSPPPSFAKDYDTLQAEEGDNEPELGAFDDDRLYIMYTSGTTGLPKGVVHTHRTALWACINITANADSRFKDRYLLVLPLYHVGALTPLTANVYQGITSVVTRTFDPVRSWELIEEEKLTVGLAVPAMLNFMLQVPDFHKYDHSQLRWIMCGGAPVPTTLVKAYAEHNVEVHEVYGLTECCGPGALISPDEALQRVGSTGKAFLFSDLKVVNDAGEPVAPGENGEVLLRGPQNMTEYWKNPEASKATLRNGWLHTGDIGVIDEDGFLYIKDRLKDMIISGGENIYPAEVENAVLSHPDVKEVAVIGQESARWGESPLAIVVSTNPGLSEGDVIQHCLSKLARFKVPKAVKFIDQIPRNPTGKIFKHKLRDQFPGPADE